MPTPRLATPRHARPRHTTPRRELFFIQHARRIDAAAGNSRRLRAGRGGEGGRSPLSIPLTPKKSQKYPRQPPPPPPPRLARYIGIREGLAGRRPGVDLTNRAAARRGEARRGEATRSVRVLRWEPRCSGAAVQRPAVRVHRRGTEDGVHFPGPRQEDQVHLP